MSNKIMSTIRLTPTAKRLLEALSEELGMTQTAVIELSIRQMAKREKIEVTEEKETANHAG